MRLIPVVHLENIEQDGGRIRKRPGRPLNAKDKAPRKKRGGKKRVPDMRKATPYPTPPKGLSAATKAARQRRLEEERIIRELGLNTYGVVDEASIKEAARRRKQAEELSGSNLTVAGARRVRDELDRERALEIQKAIAKRAEAQRREASVAEVVYRTPNRKTPAPRYTSAARQARSTSEDSDDSEGDGGTSSSWSSAYDIDELPEQVDVTSPRRASPTSDGFDEEMERVAAGYPTRVRRQLKKLTYNDEGQVPGPIRGDGPAGRGIPNPKKRHLRDDVKRVLKQSYKVAEKDGRRAAADHVRELTAIEKDIVETKRYIRSLE